MEIKIKYKCDILGTQYEFFSGQMFRILLLTFSVPVIPSRE